MPKKTTIIEHVYEFTFRLCFDQDGGDACMMTEGHRGRHEGTTGRKWGTDL